MRPLFIFLFSLSLLYARHSYAQVDTVLYQKDSVIELEMNGTAIFFQQNEKLPSPEKTSLITRTKTVLSASSFLEKLGERGEHALTDLDNDGRKELLFYNFTGGAHCCDEIYIFRNIAANKYQHVARLYAGNTLIGDSNIFYYDLYEMFGYFFTCFACSLAGEEEADPIPTSQIALKYKKGILSIVRGDQELRSRINDNLAKLGELPYEAPDAEIQQDKGQRKAVALNLAVYYFSFGKNLAQTQQLFNKYYKFPDAKKVWAEFVKTLNHVRKESNL